MDYYYDPGNFVEVVRCRDCKYFVFDKEENGYICIGVGGMNLPEENDFCSYGEREE